MANRLRRLPLAVYTPAVPAVAPQAAYCVTTQVLVGYTAASGATRAPVASIGTTAGSGGVGGAEFNPLTGSYEYLGYAAGYGGQGVTAAPPSVPRYQNLTTCYPAVPGSPAVPATVDYVDTVGWDAGGRSIDPLDTNGYFQARLPADVAGIVLGLSDGAFIHTIGHCSHAVIVRPGSITPLSYGRPVGATAVWVGGVVRFERQGGVVRVLVDGTPLHTFDLRSAGTVYADALLYSAIDFIDSPQLGEMEAPVVIDPVVHALVLDAAMPWLRLGNGAITRVELGAPVPTLALDGSQSEYTPVGVEAVLPPPLLSFRSVAGEKHAIAGSIPKPGLQIGNGPICRIESTWGGRYGLVMYDSTLGADEADGGDMLFAADVALLYGALLLAIRDGVEVSDGFELTLVIDLQLLESLGLSDSATLYSTLQLLLQEGVALASASTSAAQDALQYAVNTVTNALTTYRGYDFLQFASAGGSTWAIKADGLYRLGGDTDDGALIDALVDFGATDYGDARAKRLSAIYLGLASDGEVYVRVATDHAEERVYRAVGSGDTLRALPAKGVLGRSWRLRLEMVGASWAELDCVEIAVGSTERRVFGRRP